MKRPLSRVLLLVTALAACAQPPVLRDGVPIPYEEAAQQDLREARERLEKGDIVAATAILERFARELPQSRYLDEALFLLGEVYLGQGDKEQAALAWTRLVEERPKSRRAPEAALLAAEAYREQGRPELGRRVLELAPFQRASDQLRVRMYRLLADLSRETGDYPGAVRALALTRRDAASEEMVREVDLEIEELIEDRLRDSELEQVADELPHGPVYDRVLLELTTRQLARGEFGEALATLERLPVRLRASDEAVRMHLRERAQRGAETAVYPVGLAVPLSGPYAGFGRSALRGAVLGLEVFGDPPGRYRLVVRDTRGDPQAVGRAMRELVNEGVRVIIGPMSSSVSAAAAPHADRARLPLLTLARREDLPFLSEWVVRLGLSPADQTALLAAYASSNGSQGRFAVLHPRDTRGTLYKNLFWDEMERRGGTIVGGESYPPDAIDVQEQIRKLVGLHYLTDKERELLAERDRLLKRPLDNAERLAEPELAELPPFVDFDALFIPDVADRVALILPQLRFYDVEDVMLLGPNDWNDSKLVEIAGADARGAVFAAAFHGESAEPHVSDFVSRFYQAYGTAPDLWSAISYDAASLVRAAVNRVGHPSSGQFRDELIDMNDFQGVSGLTGFSRDGVPRRELLLLQVERKAIVPIGHGR